MTVRMPAAWEIASLDESPSIDTTGWRRPSSVKIDGDDLVFEWPSDLLLHARAYTAPSAVETAYERWRDERRFLMAFGPADIFPSRTMLLRFAQLSDAPSERIRLFAARNGALQEQVSNQPEWVAPPLLPDRQPIDYWRRMSRSFKRALDLAALPVRSPADEANLLWWVNGHLFQAAVVDFLTFDRGQPKILHGSGGLYGGLAVELLATVARIGLKLCAGCGGEVEPGGRRFCHSCRDSGVPVRLRAQRYRARRLKEPAGSRKSGQ